MDWNPADEFSGPDPRICECCDGSGVEVFGVTVYEHGCGFSHDSTDERPCKECGGTGQTPERFFNADREMQRALELDGEKLRQLTGEDHGPFNDDLPF
jgi:hypothetical protein